ncbi:hypothetical protein RHGRI_027537 [Rhododendron griersonianum]|uniref:Uncharacterized protein n=1 Tax=Rhododendron griersonianum TaxID=479676 RepID=A0AAV6IXX8_9ERIC|nr:hypothetical protein RHGRI_027537 [Rhododendron griersonianum]
MRSLKIGSHQTNVEKNDELIVKIIEAYDTATQKFQLGGKNVGLTNADIGRIFGISSGKEVLSRKYGTIDEVKMVARKKLNRERLTTLGVKELLDTYLVGNEIDDVEDVARLLCLYETLSAAHEGVRCCGTLDNIIIMSELEETPVGAQEEVERHDEAQEEVELHDEAQEEVDAMVDTERRGGEERKSMERRDYGNLLAEKDTLMKENEEKQQKIEELEKEKEIGGNYVEKDIVEEQLEDLAATMVEPNAIGERNEGQPADVADVALSLCSQGLRSEGELNDDLEKTHAGNLNDSRLHEMQLRKMEHKSDETCAIPVKKIAENDRLH